MHRPLRLPVLLLALAAAASTSVATAAPRKPAQAARACVPDEPAFWRDQGLATRVATKLSFHKPLLREKVEVKVTGGAAMLSGNVSSEKAIAEAVRTASAVGGVKCVQNYLRVGPPLDPGRP